MVIPLVVEDPEIVNLYGEARLEEIYIPLAIVLVPFAPLTENEKPLLVTSDGYTPDIITLRPDARVAALVLYKKPLDATVVLPV